MAFSSVTIASVHCSECLEAIADLYDLGSLGAMFADSNSHWGRGVLETGDYIASTFRSLAHCTQNVIVKNILSTVSQGSKCTHNVISGFQHPSPPVIRRILESPVRQSRVASECRR